MANNSSDSGFLIGFAVAAVLVSAGFYFSIAGVTPLQNYYDNMMLDWKDRVVTPTGQRATVKGDPKDGYVLIHIDGKREPEFAPVSKLEKIR